MVLGEIITFLVRRSCRVPRPPSLSSFTCYLFPPPVSVGCLARIGMERASSQVLSSPEVCIERTLSPGIDSIASDAEPNEYQSVLK
jgi:hypothetical protein